MSERTEVRHEFYPTLDRNKEIRRQYYALLCRVSKFKAVRVIADEFHLSTKHVRKVLNDMICGVYPN
jgi:hypothetical protein